MALSSTGSSQGLPNPNQYFSQQFVDENHLIIEKSNVVLYRGENSGSPTNTLIYGNGTTCLYYQFTDENVPYPDHGRVLKSLLKIQEYIDYGVEMTGFNPLGNLPYKEYTGEDGIKRRFVVEVNDTLLRGGGAAYNGRPWCATTKIHFNILYDTINDQTPKMAQVYFYELGRCLWDVKLDNIWDWEMESPSNYGYWTLGFNGMMTAIAPDQIGVELDYYGMNAQQFKQARLDDLNRYLNDPQYNFDNAWTVSRLPWNNAQTINDMMSGLIIYLYDLLGGNEFLKCFYRYINRRDETPNRTDRKERARNFYLSTYYGYSTAYNNGTSPPPINVKTMFKKQIKWKSIFL